MMHWAGDKFMEIIKNQVEEMIVKSGYSYKEEYSYKDNIICFAEKQIVFSEKIAEIIEFEKFLIIRNKYSKENPTNNLAAFDFDGNKIWEIDDIIKPLAPQTIVSIGKKDCHYVNIITFTGLNLLIEAETGQILEKKIIK